MELVTLNRIYQRICGADPDVNEGAKPAASEQNSGQGE
jgi:hypothetical protein